MTREKDLVRVLTEAGFYVAELHIIMYSDYLRGSEDCTPHYFLNVHDNTDKKRSDSNG